MGGAALDDLHGADAVTRQGEGGTQTGLAGAEDEDVVRPVFRSGDPVVVVADERHVGAGLVRQRREAGGRLGIRQGGGAVALRLGRVIDDGHGGHHIPRVRPP